MASVAVGPGGVSVQGQHQCSNNNFLGDQGNPLAALINTVTEQRITGMTRMRYPEMASAVDRHMPMRAATSSRINGNKTYRTSVAYEGLLNSDGIKDITPSSSGFNNPRNLLTACGGTRAKNIGSSANVNAEGCNPVIDGPIPIIGREEFGRRAFVTRMVVPPMCFMDFTDKENFLMHLSAVLDSVNNGTMARWGADQLRWLISKGRFNVSPVQQSRADGKVVLPYSADLFTEGTFGRVPQHWGSADWMAAQLRLSEIDPRQNLVIDLPTSIFKKYKQELLDQTQVNIFDNPRSLTSAMNGYMRDIQNENIIYTDEVYGRRITFRATTEPIYVEFSETTTGGGEWEFQESWIHRDSETSDQVMSRHNPNWGVACSCPGRTLGAIVMVSAEGARPFYKEPMPNDNPAAGINALIGRYSKKAGAEVNTTLAQVYPSSVETTILTGLDAQIYMLDPINRRYRDAGYNCDVASNLANTWIAGYTTVAGQFVEENPRALVIFALKVPQSTPCVEASVGCDAFDPIPAELAFDPLLRAQDKQLVEIPAPEEAEEAASGAIYQRGKLTSVTSPCTGTLAIGFELFRRDGSAGALTVTIAGTPSTHGGTIPGSVSFADGEMSKQVTWNIPAWVCEDEQTTENFTITLGGDMGDDANLTRNVCIKCAPYCPTDCEPNEGACASC